VSTEAETAMLREHGHTVVPYIRDNRDIELDTLGRGRGAEAVRLGGTTVWSHSAYREVKELLRENSFDIMHVQNTFPQISPSILYAARGAGVAVVQSLRNYRLTCANGTLYRDGAVCELCVGRKVGMPAIQYKCYRDDTVASGAVVALQSIHRLARSYRRSVSVYIALTEFSASQHVKGGIPNDRIVVKPNFMAEDPGPGAADRSGYLYVGRLSAEKGVDTMIKAWETIAAPLTIVGDGPMVDWVEKEAVRNENINYAGPLPHADAVEALGSVRAAIMPSQWYEPFGRGVIEAYARATPVIGAAIGGLSELVDDGRTGLLFEAGNPAALTRAVEKIEGMSDLPGMAAAARAEYESKYTAAANYPQLLAAYDRAFRDRPA
ncbi:MAG: glycosyltransferase, partial [Acidimicrobiia bacterium]|nr:glycosyltransferase [Acidimicrobiia bacterium]